MAEPQARKPIYKMITFWLALLLILYTLAGFVFLPWWLQRQVPEQLSTQLGWQGDVTDIDFNPFTMTLEVEGLDATDGDGQRVVAMDELHVDLTVWRLVTGTVAFESIRLQKPFVRVDLLEDYGVNLVNDWNQHHPVTEDAPPEEDGPAEPPQLYFGEIQLTGGQIQFRDFSQGKEQDFDITPLNVTLNDLATVRDDGNASDYTLSAAVNDQQIDWKGKIGLMPFHSNGHITLTNIAHSTLWHFASPYAPYVVGQGQLSLSTDYAISSAGEFALATQNGKLQLNDVSASLPEADNPFATLKTLAVDGIAFNLHERTLSISSVDLDTLKGDLSRSKDGLINVMQPFAKAEGEPDQDTPPAQENSQNDGFAWQIDSVRLGNSALKWHDEALATPADVTVTGINAELGPLTQALEEPVPYKLELKSGDSGTLSTRGQTTLSPFTLESVLSLDNLALAPFEPYVQQTADVGVASGTLTVQGNLDLDAQNPALTGTFSGSGQVRDLALTRAGKQDRLLSWSSLLLNPIELNMSPGRLEIGTITLTDPDAHIVRAADGTTNLSGLVKASDDDSAPQKDSAGANDKPDFIFRVSTIQLENGQFDFADRTIEPVFTTKMQKVNGMVEGLSNVSPQKGSVRVDGQIGEGGNIKLDGSIGTLGAEDTSSLKLSLDNMAMAELSPYFGRFLGYAVDSGKLRMDLKYDITGSDIKADNHIVMDQLTLGQAVQSDEAVDVPVKLGLTLLRDTDGIIDIDLPIEGNLDDPEFRIGRVVMRTFVNLLAKAATSPFNMLGSVAELAGLSGEELGQVEFLPGQSTLGPDEDKKLELLAKALKDKPQLLLNVRGAVAPELDGLALKSERMNASLNLSSNTPREKRVQALEGYFSQTKGQQALTRLQQSSNQTGDARLKSADWVATLTRELTADVDVPPEALDRLAKARGTLLQKRLAGDYGIPDDQLFLLAPSNDAKTEMSDDAIRVIVPFSMDTR